MDIELGITNVARPVSFSTNDDADTVTAAIESALADGTPIKLTDDKGRRVLVPAQALGYALIGSETKHAVGFGAL
ncbi:DUF3107 domain-containing protein [Bifidobacterium leontopitheci]|uniref:ATP-binding protein n=1 Tax=Bifidobacterium leontopitheci TaxID=2650774 RepID=A0A6I1GKN1_9BIFI|nr:DUF3107 domain-containing protein [Bifidobacterium leontopitheci]KAB7789999.1 ATP-binding protein [Bifidobacterium leontopitheci]